MLIAPKGIFHSVLKSPKGFRIWKTQIEINFGKWMVMSLPLSEDATSLTLGPEFFPNTSLPLFYTQSTWLCDIAIKLAVIFLVRDFKTGSKDVFKDFPPK